MRLRLEFYNCMGVTMRRIIRLIAGHDASVSFGKRLNQCLIIPVFSHF